MQNTMNRWRLKDTNLYSNFHSYDNKESRWCDLNRVPYARNGYLYGQETIEDQITNTTYYPWPKNSSTYQKFNRDFMENKITTEDLFQVNDTLLVRHFQADVRFKITSFSPKAGNIIGTRLLNENYQFNKDVFVELESKNPNKPAHVNYNSWNYGAAWLTKQVINNIQENKIARVWNWTAVPKDTYFKLQLLGYV